MEAQQAEVQEEALTPLQQHAKEAREEYEESIKEEDTTSEAKTEAKPDDEPAEPAPIIEAKEESEESKESKEISEEKPKEDKKDAKDINALIHQRIQNRKVKEENNDLKELVEALTNKEEPAKVKDPAKPSPWEDEEAYEAYVLRKAEEKMMKKLEPLQQQIAMQQFDNQYSVAEKERMDLESKDPAFKESFNYIREQLVERIMMENPQMGAGEVMFALKKLELDEYNGTGKRGKYLANHYKDLAESNGFQIPNILATPEGEEEPEPKDFEATKKLKEKATGFTDVPGKTANKKKLKVSKQEYMEMTTAERAQLPRTLRKQILASM